MGVLGGLDVLHGFSCMAVINKMIARERDEGKRGKEKGKGEEREKRGAYRW